MCKKSCNRKKVANDYLSWFAENICKFTLAVRKPKFQNVYSFSPENVLCAKINI